MSTPVMAIINDHCQVLTLFTLLLEDAGYHTITYTRGVGA